MVPWAYVGLPSNLTPATPKKNPQPIVAKIFIHDYLRDSYHPGKFYSDRIGDFLSAHA